MFRRRAARRPRSSWRVLRPTRSLALAILTTTMALASLVAGAAPSASAATTTPARAMWVWTLPPQPGDVVTFATSHGIGQLFVAVPPDLPTSSALPAVSDLVSQAREAGLRVDALGGDPGWIDNPTWVVNRWLKPAVATGLFTGLHVDIEPYTTPAWSTNQAGVVKKYLATLDQLRIAAGTRPVEADLPFWAHQIPAGNRSTLSREALKRTAGASIMAYRNTAAGVDGTLAIAAAQLADGVALGKPIRIGQETNYLGSSPTQTKQTFYGMTQALMNDEFDQIDAGASAYSSYAGIALQDYTGYAAMAP